MKQPSAAIQLLTLVWEKSQLATSHSWLKLNHAMAGALGLAIRAGMQFDLDDWNAMKRFRPGYWRQTEMDYRLAVLYRNASAWKAIEKHLNRKPFIIPGASCHASHYGDGPAGHGLARIVIGATFPWDGHARVQVTSINDAKGYLVACVPAEYEPPPTPQRHVKPNNGRYIARVPKPKAAGRQYKITHADIKAFRRKAA